MYQMKNYLSKTLLIGFLSLVLGCTAATLPSAVNITDNNSYSIVIISLIGIAGVIVLFLLNWEQLLFLFALSLGFQLYDPSPYEAFFFILILMFLVKKVPMNGKMFNNFIFALLFLFLVFGTFSIFFSINIYKAAAWHLITVYLVMSALFLFLVIKNDKQFSFFLKGYVVGAVINSIWGFIVYFAGKSEGGRLNGFFQDPNIFSPYIIIASMLVIEDILSPKLFRSKPFKVISVVLLVGSVVLAMSRAGWINLAFALLLYLGVKVLKRQLRPGFFIKLILIPLVLFLSVHFFFPDLTDLAKKRLEERTTLQYYDNDRFEAQNFTLKVAEHHLFGIGPGEITTIYYMDPHNSYYRIFAEYGWLAGSSLMLLFLTLGWILMRKSLSLDKKEFNIYLVFLCTLAGTLVNISVVDALHWRHFWVFFGLCCYCIFIKKEQALKGEIQ